MTGDQVRAARAFLGWTQHELAGRAKVGFRSVRRIEAGEGVSELVRSAVCRVLREAGVVAFTGIGELAALDVVGGVALLKAGGEATPVT